jgi:hypothetical protein
MGTVDRRPSAPIVGGEVGFQEDKMGDPVLHMGLIEAQRVMAAHVEGAGPGDGRQKPIGPAPAPARRMPLAVVRRRAGLALVWCGQALLRGVEPARAEPACGQP